ncbi:hypothetical protein [Paenibacillus sp. DCT19]|uniref:hypothetical protein n=1 Tax=Paenibacillus sp. DCT19 TaxID=2211212 RepID=UPI0020C5A55B|nr:hypothetical protein [Paenibacillus sp. DCT19]
MDMRREIQQVHRNTRSAIVYVTHDQGEALAMADRIIVMKDGRIEQAGTPQDIYLRPQTEFVAKFVSKSNLVTGHWEANRFMPKDSENVSWSGADVADYFKLNGLYPVRPDQFRLQPHHQPGMDGKIVNVQFQGKEFHYDIQGNAGRWEVISPLAFSLNEQVSLSLSFAQNEGA